MIRIGANPFAAFFAALRFFTRIPVPSAPDGSYDARQHLEQALPYLPLIGILVGAIGASITALALQLLPPALAVLAGMAATLLATGAFHEDGFADAVDAFGGAMDKTRVLEIMKDPRIGSFGAIAIAMMLLAKFEVLLGILARDGIRGLALALIAAHAVSRLAPVFLVCALEYVRDEATSKSAPLTTKLSMPALGAATIVGSAPGLLLSGRMSLPAFAAYGLAAVSTALAGRYFYRRIGGYTGDCLGAAQQLCEIAFYCGLLCGFT
ncbi:MAG: adenosylcobinamide-GDP ribazoletransferase [Burkholderiaceae bacterium]|nr:adenosylcobinamide-GDP ribazoletransferase [Burkholderiaceae bacterium]